MGDSLHHEIAIAAERGMEVISDPSAAIAAHFDPDGAALIVVLRSGAEVKIPVALIEGLADSSDEARCRIEVSLSGLGLHWPELDLDLSVPGLLAGVFGTRKWMDNLRAARAGASISPAKAEAARRNGAKGGRPRKSVA
jgi:hypothetical protein